MSISDLGAGQAAAVASVLNQPAENFGNEATLEFHWAMKALHHAEVYFNLLVSVDPSSLKLTKMDDEIYSDYRAQFPDMKVDVIKEDDIKNAEQKEKWRHFLKEYEHKVEDWNMGTLLRLDSAEDVSENNTTLVPRMQFLAIEIARNREGENKQLRKKFGKSKDSNTESSQTSS